MHEDEPTRALSAATCGATSSSMLGKADVLVSAAASIQADGNGTSVP
jgi:hypothetical protein